MEITAKSMDHLFKQHLAAQGITSKETLQPRLQVIFEESDHQERALIALYRMVIPDWERLQQLEGFPVVGQKLWQYICQLFIDFDQRHHPDVFKGGLWINQGFSSSRELGPWEINLDQCRFIYA